MHMSRNAERGSALFDHRGHMPSTKSRCSESLVQLTNPQKAMLSGSAASFDLFAQIAVYAFWGVLLLYYFISAIGQTLQARPKLQLGEDVLRWTALLVVQLGVTCGIIYLAIGIGTDQIGM